MCFVYSQLQLYVLFSQSFVKFMKKKIHCHLVCWFSSYFDQPTSQGKALCGILYCGVIHAMKSAQHVKTTPTVYSILSWWNVSTVNIFQAFRYQSLKMLKDVINN